MSSFASRALILSAARLFSQGVLMLSPMLLVRLLDVVQYGQYRQFVVVCGLFILLAMFSMGVHLSYFVARSPEHSSRYITHSCLLLLLTSVVAATILVVFRETVIPEEIIQFWPLMAVYVMLHVNLDIYVSYWVARKRSDRVLYYSVAEVSARIGAVVLAAWAFGDLRTIFLCMIGVEVARVLFLWVWLLRSGLLKFSIDREILVEQVRFILPMGTGSLLWRINHMSGKYIVGLLLGPAQLAIFTIAAYKAPLMSIVKTAVSEVIFPDMVERSAKDQLAGLRLWQRTNIVYLLIMLPACTLLVLYTEPLVVFLFTAEYRAAAPLMQALLLMMIIECFNFSVPLRSLGINKPFVIANSAALAMNVTFTLGTLPTLGLWAPVLGLLVSQSCVTSYLGVKVMAAFNVSVANLLEWRKLFALLVATGTAWVAHFVILEASGPGATGVLFALAGFCSTYIVTVMLLRVEEFFYLLRGLHELAVRQLHRRAVS